jgi:hypothetical protein
MNVRIERQSDPACANDRRTRLFSAVVIDEYPLTRSHLSLLYQLSFPARIEVTFRRVRLSKNTSARFLFHALLLFPLPSRKDARAERLRVADAGFARRNVSVSDALSCEPASMAAPVREATRANENNQ